MGGGNARLHKCLQRNMPVYFILVVGDKFMEKRSSRSKKKKERGPREGVEGSRIQTPVHARLCAAGQVSAQLRKPQCRRLITDGFIDG